jgi:exonuclease SbcC
MILNNLKLANYKQYAALSLDFREGLVGIIGKNGAGKSTIFEAILYCLFGRDESNKNLVRSSFADPKANVELALEFTIGESLYRVRREFRGKALAVGAELFKNDQLVAKGVSAVNDELVKVLHIERDAFKRSVFSGQKELSELSDTSGEARKRMVRKMLGLDTLDEVQSKVNSDIRDLNSRVAGQSQNLLDDEAIGVLEMEIGERETALEENKLSFEKENKKLKAVEEQYKVEQQKFEEEERRLGRYNAVNRELGQLQERLSGLQLQKENLEQKSRDLQQQKEKLDAARGEFATYETEKKLFASLETERQRKLNRDAYSSQFQTLEEPLRQSRDNLARLGNVQAEKTAVETALQEKQEMVRLIEKEREEKLAERETVLGRKSEIAGLIAERKTKIENLAALGKSGTCPTCLQPLMEGYERALAQLKEEIDRMQTAELQRLELQEGDIVAAGLQIKNRLTEARAEVTRLLSEQTRLTELARQKTGEESNLQRLEAEATKIQLILREIGEVNFDEAAYSALKAKLAAQEPRYLEFSKEENHVARELPATLHNLKNIETALAETGKNATAKSEELAGVGYNEPTYNAAKQALTGFADTFNIQSEAVRTLEKTGLELKNRIAQDQEKLRANDRIKSQISDKLAEIDLLRKLAEMLGLFKTEILEKISPGISREASDLFSRITKGKYESIRVDENFDFAIADGGVFYPIERFSGGEIDLANFCLRIAITKAIMDLSGAEQGIGFLAFDEIFGSQDEERRLEMMLALNYLQEQFRQIYIVSHIESLKDYFPHILEVQFGEGGSSVVWR